MLGWLSNVIAAAGTVVLTLTVTLIFNKIVGLPKELKKQRELIKLHEAQVEQENQVRDKKIADLEAVIDTFALQQKQNLQLQQEQRTEENTILKTCNKIQQDIKENNVNLSKRLDRLEKREKNAIRAKLLEEYRLFTSEDKNPKHAWSEMEHHAFFELVKDYEDLDGNDYVHSEVIPAVNRLEVIMMADQLRLTELMKSRNF